MDKSIAKAAIAAITRANTAYFFIVMLLPLLKKQNPKAFAEAEKSLRKGLGKYRGSSVEASIVEVEKLLDKLNKRDGDWAGLLKPDAPKH